MVAHWILAFYHNYALFLGVTSHQWVSGSFKQSKLTLSYALVANLFVLFLLPYAMWLSAMYMGGVDWFPNHIPYTTYVLYVVAYVATAYTIISRGSRDRALIEVDRVISRLKRLKSCKNAETEHIGDSLRYLFYMKLGAVIYLCLWSITSWLVMPMEGNLVIVLCAFFFSNALNIPLIATYRYFMALWDIANGYQYINSKLQHFIKCVRKRYPTKVELMELHRLWSLHALLGRCTLKMNRVYGMLMLSARFDNLAFSVINGYWAIVFTFSLRPPVYVLLYAGSNYNMRLFDFFLLNYMCDLAIEHQSCAQHLVSEGYWFKELNAFVLYANTSKMSLWVCGLYKVNRRCWFQMMLSILNFAVLLLQFHLLIQDKYAV